MNSCLLIGNGINRCCGGMSWEKLLSKIAHLYFVSSDTVESSVLAFEQLRSTVLSQNIHVTTENFALDVLQELDTIDRQAYYDLYSRFLALPITDILTTNFDYSIERTIIEDYQYSAYTGQIVRPQETKCSCIRHNTIKDKRIFHIHGELGKKGTICLGSIHYATNLNSIMSRILDYDKGTDTYTLKECVFGENFLTWAQFFFTKNIYIIGLGLYDCDMDLWWLIAYRKQLKLQGNKSINNKITYYYLYEQKNQNFKDCLTAMDIEVKELQIKDNRWREAYFNISEDIKSNIE